jgi:hypothetical protein
LSHRTRRGRVALLALAIAALLAPSSVGAYEVDVTAGVTGEYLRNTDLDASMFDGRVELDAAAGPLTLGAVYRVYQLTDPTYNPAGIDVPPSEVKHRYAEFEQGGVLVRGGHFLSTLGRGLLLRSFEDVELEYDTVLDGFMGEYSGDALNVTVLSGAVTEELTGTSFYEHVARGVRVGVSPADWVGLGAGAMERSRTKTDDELNVPEEIARFEDVLVGGDLDVWVGPLSLSAEYAARDGENPTTNGDVISGHGAHVAGTVDLSWVTLFGEYKDYDSFQHYLVSPATCIRDHPWTFMNRATHEVDLDDERGFLFEASAPLGESTFVTGGASEARTDDGELKHWDIFGQADRSLSSALDASIAGSVSREYLRGKFTERLIGALELDLSLSPHRGIELAIEVQTTEEPSGETYEDYLASVTLYPGSDLTVVVGGETTTQENVDRDAWLMVEMRKLLATDLEVALAAGTVRGGKKCSGGVCYIEPPFEGARLRFTTFF